MKYTVQKLKQSVTKGIKFEYIGFWGQHCDNELEKSFSNFYVAPFKAILYNNTEFLFDSNEQYFMYRKALFFNDFETIDLLLVSGKHSAEYKKLGKQIKNFDEKTWRNVRYDILMEGLRLKFTQNKQLKDYLLSTGDKILVETSPMDKVYGTCVAKYDFKNRPSELWKNPQNWLGANLLGFALMELRDELNIKK